VFGGYSYTHAGEASLHGVGFSGSYPLGRSLGLVLDLSGHTGSFAGADIGQIGVLAGARWTWHLGRVRPFAEALIGAVRSSASVDVGAESISDSSWGLGLGFGAGAGYELSGPWSLRGLFHLRVVDGETGSSTDPRFAVGVAYRFGR
jgi:opacity protein-like surface antigen